MPSLMLRDLSPALRDRIRAYARRRGLSLSAGAAELLTAGLDLDTPDAETWSASEIRALRQQLGESAAVFGARFDRGQRTVEDWEQGRRRPDALTRAAMQTIARQ